MLPSEITLVLHEPDETSENTKYNITIRNPGAPVINAMRQQDPTCTDTLENPNASVISEIVNQFPAFFSHLVELNLPTTITEEMITVALTSEQLINPKRSTNLSYEELVNKVYSDNELLQRKWMRYYNNHKN